MKKLTIIYTRVSTDRQATEGTSIETQELLIRNYLHQKNPNMDQNLIYVISDAGESGSTMNRPGFKRVLDLIKSDQVETLIFSSLDRLTRKQQDLVNFLPLISEKKVSLISLREQVDTSSVMGRVWLTNIVGFAEIELDLIRERVSRGRKHTQSLGKFPGGAVPYGYKADKQASGGLFIINEEATVVKSIFYYRMRLKLGYLKIANRLNGRNFTKRDGKPWTAKAVERILKNQEFYQAKSPLHQDQAISYHIAII
jgi:site-specific DNA recombinase